MTSNIRLWIGAAACLGFVASASSSMGRAAPSVRTKPPSGSVEARDCTPIVGPHGYYGNAWCDGGFLTLEEQEYRHAKRLDIDRHAYRYRDGRRKLFRAR